MPADFDSASQAAAIAALAALAATALLFLYALGLRISHILHARLRLRLQLTWWPVLADAAVSLEYAQCATLPRLADRHRPEILRQWCTFRNSVRGASSESLNILARRTGLLALARTGLDQRALGSKLMAVQAIGLLQDQHSWSAIMALLDHQSVAMSVTAATALVDIDAPHAIPVVLPFVCRNDHWPRTQVARFLANAGADVVSGPLCAAITNGSDDVAARLLRYSDCIASGDLNKLVQRLLHERRDPNLLAAALKAARALNCADTVIALTRHKVWFVRMQAASVLGQFGTQDCIRALEPLMSDPEWWVRYRAAQAIVALPFLGPHALRRLRDRQRDRFARDMLQQALAERGVA